MTPKLPTPLPQEPLAPIPAVPFKAGTLYDSAQMQAVLNAVNAIRDALVKMGITT